MDQRAGMSRRGLLKGGVAAGAVGLTGIGGMGTAGASHRRPWSSENEPRRGRDRDYVIRDAHIMTLDPTLGEIPGGDVLIRNGRIAEVGQRVAAGRASKIDGSGMIAMPGLIDNHRHLWVSLLRAYSGNQSFGPYIEEVHAAISPHLTPRDMYLGGLLGTLEALHSGVTTVVDWNHGCNTREHALAAVEALRESEARTVFAYSTPAMVQTDVDAGPTEDDMRAVHDAVGDDRLVDFAVATRSPRVIPGPEGLDRIAQDVEFARDLGVFITSHFGFDDSEALRSIADRELLGPDFTLVHANQLTSNDFRVMADAGGWISSSPEVEMQMSFGPAPLRRMLEGGIRPTLSVDILTVTPGEMFEQMKIMLQTQRMLDHQEADEPLTELLPVGDMLPYATTNAAGSIGMESEIGSLTPGKQADIVLLDGRDLNMALATDAATAAVLMAHPGVVDTVMVGGRIMKRNKKLVVDVDLERLLHEASKASERLLEHV